MKKLYQKLYDKHPYVTDLCTFLILTYLVYQGVALFVSSVAALTLALVHTGCVSCPLC